MEVFDPIFSTYPLALLGSDDKGFTFKASFEEMMQSSGFASNRSTALRFLVLGAILTWQDPTVDSTFLFDNDQGGLEMLRLKKDQFSGWTTDSFFFSMNSNGQSNLSSGELNMNHLVESLAQRTSKNKQEAFEMVTKALESCRFVSFDDTLHVRDRSVTLKTKSFRDDNHEGRIFVRFDPLAEFLELEKLNPLFGRENTSASNSLTYFKQALEYYFRYFTSKFPTNSENYLDFVHGVLLNIQNKFSLRIYRPGIYGDLAVGTQDVLLQSFSPIIYFHQERAFENVTSSFHLPDSWETFEETCTYLKIRSTNQELHWVPGKIAIVKFQNETFSLLNDLGKLTGHSGVYWPEAIFGELVAKRNVSAKHFIVSTSDKLEHSERFSFAFGRPDGSKVLIHVVEYDGNPLSRRPTTVSRILAEQNYDVYDLHVLSPDATPRAEVASQILHFSQVGQSSNFSSDEPGMTFEVESLPGSISIDLFKDPAQTMKSIMNNAIKSWPYWRIWTPEQVSSFFNGVFSSDIGVHFKDGFLSDAASMYVYKNDSLQRGLILKIAEGKVDTKIENEFKNLEASLQRHVTAARLPSNFIAPRIVLLSLDERNNLVSKPKFDSDRRQQCTGGMGKPAITCEYDEAAEKELFESKKPKEERFIRKFKSYDELQTAVQKETYYETQNSTNFQKATRWNNALMELQSGKNIHGEMIEDDWKGVAFHTGFLIGSEALDKIDAMVVGEPVLSRLSSAFLAVELYNQWHGLNNGSTVDVMGDGAAIDKDARKTPWLDFMPKVRPFVVVYSITNPIVSSFAIVDSIMANNHIDSIVSLSKLERVKEFLSDLMWKAPTSYIQQLLSEKSMNDRSMDKFAERFKCSRKVSFYTRPAQYLKRIKCQMESKCIVTTLYPNKVCKEVREVCDNKLLDSEDNSADFRAKKTMFSRTFPKSIENFELQCSNATTFQQTDKDESQNMFPCSNMISIKIDNATSDISFIRVGSGNDFIYGFEENDNVMTIGAGKKQIVGGRKADLFILYGNDSITGTIDGSDGTDEVNLLLYSIKGTLKIEPMENTSNLILTGGLQLQNIEKITGRAEMPEIVHADCNLNAIDLKGGTNQQPDQVIIDDSPDCQKKLAVLIQGPFHVENRATSGDFHYLVRHGHKLQTILLETGETASNLITFNYSLTEVHDITHAHIPGNNIFERVLSFRFDHDKGEGPQTHILFKSDNSLIRFLFNDNVTLVHTGSKLIGYKEVHDGSAEDLIERYGPVANTNHIHLVLNIRNKTKVFIGHGSYKNSTIEEILNNHTSTSPKLPINVMTNDLDTDSHLVAGNTENLFLMRARINQTTQSFLYKRTFLHFFPGMKNSTIDVSDLASKHKNFSATLTLELMFEDSGDVTLMLGTQLSSNDQTKLFGIITLKHFPANVLNDLITIKTDNEVLRINDTQQLSPESKSAHYSNETQVIIIMGDIQIDHLIIDHPIHDTKLFQCNQLLLMKSKIFKRESETDVQDVQEITVTVPNYFNVTLAREKKFNDLQFDFINRSFFLIEILESSDDFLDMCKRG